MRLHRPMGNGWWGVGLAWLVIAGTLSAAALAQPLPNNPLPTNPLPPNPHSLPAPQPTFAPSASPALLGTPPALGAPATGVPAAAPPSGSQPSAQPTGNVQPLPGPAAEPPSPSATLPAPGTTPPPAPATTTTQLPAGAKAAEANSATHNYRRVFCGSGHHTSLEFHFVELAGTVAYTVYGQTYVAPLKYLPVDQSADKGGMTYNHWEEAADTGHPQVDAWRIARRPHCGTYAVQFRTQGKWYTAPVTLLRTVAQ